MLPGMATPSLPRNLRLPGGKEKKGASAISLKGRSLSVSEIWSYLKRIQSPSKSYQPGFHSAHRKRSIRTQGGWGMNSESRSCVFLSSWMTVGDTWISWIDAPILKRQTPEPHCVFARCTQANSRSYSCAPDMRTKSWCYICDP